MDNARRVVKNTLALSTNSAARLLLAMALQVAIARRLGASGLGKYAVTLAFVAIFQIVSDLGLPRLVIREVARRTERASQYFYGALTAQLIGATLAYAALLTITRLFNYAPDTLQALMLGGASLFPYACTSASNAIFQAHERMELTAIAEVAGLLVQLAAALALLWLGYGVVALAGTIVLGRVVAAVLALWMVGRLGVLRRPRIDLGFSWHLVRSALEFYALALSVVVYSRMNIVIISQLLGEEAAGIYNAAYLVVRAFALAITGYSDALYPALSRLYAAADDRGRFIGAGQRSLRYGLLLALPTAMGVALLAPKLIAWVYRHGQYERSVILLTIVIWEIVPFFMNAVLSRILIASNLQRLSVRVAIGKLALSLIYYLALTPTWGLPGAAVATVLSTATGSVLNWRYVTRYAAPLDLKALAFKPALAAAAMGLGFLVRLQWGPIVAVGVAIGIYGGALLALRAISMEDWTLLRNLVWQEVAQ
ncbi:MAG: flippase [Anaerolineae bacterium]|nr:flippase [Anaerolineae bacterium]